MPPPSELLAAGQTQARVMSDLSWARADPWRAEQRPRGRARGVHFISVTVSLSLSSPGHATTRRSDHICVNSANLHLVPTIVQEKSLSKSRESDELVLIH